MKVVWGKRSRAEVRAGEGTGARGSRRSGLQSLGADGETWEGTSSERGVSSSLGLEVG